MIVSAVLHIIVHLSYCCDTWVNYRAFMFSARKIARIAASTVIPDDVVYHP